MYSSVQAIKLEKDSHRPYNDIFVNIVVSQAEINKRSFIIRWLIKVIKS